MPEYKEYKKRTKAELAVLLSRRGLEPGGTKTQMTARLVKQDAEDDAAAKATAAAVKAASSVTNTHNEGREKGSPSSSGKDRKSEKGGKGKGDAERAKKSEDMRRARLEAARSAKGKKGKYGWLDLVPNEEDEVIDDEAYVRELMTGGSLQTEMATGHVGGEYNAGPYAQKSGGTSSGIIVNMTPDTPTLRGGGRGRTRTRWQSGNEHKTSSSLLASKTTVDDDDALSEASTIRLTSLDSPSTISYTSSHHGFATAFKLLVVVILVALVWVLGVWLGSMGCLMSLWKSIMGTKSTT